MALRHALGLAASPQCFLRRRVMSPSTAGQPRLLAMELLPRCRNHPHGGGGAGPFAPAFFAGCVSSTRPRPCASCPRGRPKNSARARLSPRPLFSPSLASNGDFLRLLRQFLLRGPRHFMKTIWKLGGRLIKKSAFPGAGRARLDREAVHLRRSARERAGWYALGTFPSCRAPLSGGMSRGAFA